MSLISRIKRWPRNNGLRLVVGVGVVVWLLFPGFASAAALLSEMTVTDKVSGQTMAPIGERSSFTDDVAEVWATAFLSDAAKGTAVSTIWYLRDEGEFKPLVHNRVEAEGKRYIAFRIRPGDGNKLPVGDYRVDFFLGDEPVGKVNFVVAAAAPTPVSAAPEAKDDYCPSQAQTDKDVAALVEENGEAMKALKLIRYTDPQNRFSMIVPGSWFPADSKDPNQALFLSQNMENDPIAWLAVFVFKVNLSPEFGVMDTLKQLRDMLLKEGEEHEAKEIPVEGAAMSELRPGVAQGSLALTYQGAGGKEIHQAHTLVVDGNYAFNIQISTEAATLETASFLHKLAGQTLWTEGLCKQMP